MISDTSFALVHCAKSTSCHPLTDRWEYPISTSIETRLQRQAGGLFKYHCSVNKACGRVVFENYGKALWGCVGRLVSSSSHCGVRLSRAELPVSWWRVNTAIRCQSLVMFVSALVPPSPHQGHTETPNQTTTHTSAICLTRSEYARLIWKYN